MTKYLIYVCIFMIGQTALAGELPMLPIKTSPSTPQQPINTQNGYGNYYNNHSIPGFYYYNYLYSTTLTTNELRARGEARRRAKLEAKCKANKARKSKCKELMED